MIRDPLHLALVYGKLALYRSRFNHDAPGSVRRAYTVMKMHQILSKAWRRG
jgi:hypothetical protein